MKTLIIIPAFNEEKNLPTLIEDIKSYGYDYLIINDCSTDNTLSMASDNKYNILNLPVNMGIAGVTRIGFMYAYDNDYDCVVSVDGDGQHQPSYIHGLIKEIENGYDYVVGSRFIDEEKPFSLRMIGSRMLCFLIKIKTGKTVTDPTSGMRAVGKKVVLEFSKGMNFFAEPDALCYLIKRGFNTKEIQVTMEERKEGTSYFMNPFKSLKYMIEVIISILLIQR